MKRSYSRLVLTLNNQPMTLQEITRLICVLKEENKTNSPQEREFNNQWIAQLKRSCEASITKAYGK